MNTRDNKGLCSLILLALLFYQVIPAGAEDVALGEQEFRLEFDEFLADDELSLEMEGLPAVDAQSTEPIRIAELAAIQLRDIPRYAQVSAEQDTTTSSPGKIERAGRWMKKHWWAPTLIGVAIAVWVLEPFDDDDAERRQAQMMQ